MAFDLSTARIVKPKGFDMSTARLAGTPPIDPVRDKAEADTAAQNAKIAAGHKAPGMLESAGRYLGEWGQGMRDAVTAPSAPGPTGVDVIDSAAGIADAALTFGTGMADPFIQIPRTLVGRAFGSDTPYSENQGDLVWEPKTPGGQAITRAAGAVIKPVADAAGAFGQGAGGAARVAGFGPQAQQDFAQMVPDAVMSAFDLAGLRAAKGAAAPALDAVNPPPPALGEVRNPRPMGDAAARGRQSGFLLTPDAVTTQRQLEAPLGERPGDAPGKMLAQVVGPEGPHAILIENQKNANRLAQRDLGLQEDGRLDPVALEAARMPHNAVFDEVARALPTLRTDWELGNAAAAIGEARRTNPLLRSTASVEDVRDRLLSMEQVPTQDALDAIRSYRQDAGRLFRQTEVGGSGVGVLEAEQAAFAYRAAADALESAIERQVGVLYPDLLPRLRDSRTALAKSHNVEASLVGAPGNYHVDPGQVAKLGEKFPLTGWLKEIADFNNSFPQLSGSRVGVNNPSPQMQSPGAAGNPRHWMNRWFGERFIPRMLSDEFQNEFGRFEPGYDPNPPARPPAPSPFADFTPPDPNAPGGGNVMPPAPGGGGLGELIDPAANFDSLPPADAQLGDFTADIPPGPEGVPFQASDLVDAPANMGLEPPPARFTGGPDELPFDQGLDFMLDPDMTSASIVRGGADPGTVQDSLALDQARMGAELRGVPLDPETGAQIAPEGVREPFTRPDPNLGDFVTGFGDEPPDPLLRGPEPPLEGEWIPGGPRPKRPPRNPNAGAEDAIGPDQLTGPDDLGAFVDDVPLLPGPQKRLTGPAAVDSAPDPRPEWEYLQTQDGYVRRNDTDYSPYEETFGSPADQAANPALRRNPSAQSAPLTRAPGGAKLSLADEPDLVNLGDRFGDSANYSADEIGWDRIARTMEADELDENTAAALDAREQGNAGPRELSDELNLTDDVMDFISNSGPKPRDDLSLRTTDKADPYVLGSDKYIFPDSKVITLGDPRSGNGHVAFTPREGGEWQLTSTALRDDLKGQGKGVELIVEGLRQLGDAPVVGDKSVSWEHAKSMRGARAKGIIDFDEPNPAAIDEAIELRSRATLNQPAFTNIRLGPAG
jgi:hypothetical protein